MMSPARFAFGLASVLLLAIGAPAAQAATYTVDSGVDIAGFGNCTAAPNDCTLRQAVNQANATTGVADEIVLAANPQLTINGTDENLNASDDIDVNTLNGGAVTIRSDTGMRT